MLSTQYRIRMQRICEAIELGEPVGLHEMIWAEKLAKANGHARTMLSQARRKAQNPDMDQDGLDGFLNALDLGDPDPSNHRTGFSSADEIADWFTRDDTDTDEWRRRD